MSAYFLDLDGVFFKYGTMQPVVGAVASVQRLNSEGHQVFFVTKRSYQNNTPPHLNLHDTKKVLQELSVSYTDIIEGVDSPRILVNDEGAIAINHNRDHPLTSLNELPVLEINPAITSRESEKIYHALTTIAWSTWKYHCHGDADDYVQTMLIIKSLLKRKGFKHRDIVRRYREKPGYVTDGHELNPGGIALSYKGQVAKLLASSDPEYMATDGVSDGSAMKVTGIVGYYLHDFDELVKKTDAITRITHGSVEARLAALLIALRLRQIVLDVNPDSTRQLISDFWLGTKILGLASTGKTAFFTKLIKKAAKLVEKNKDPQSLLLALAQEIGLEHVAWSTPVSACFWSFHSDNEFQKWQNPEHELILSLPRKRLFKTQTITHETLKESVYEDYEAHLKKIGEYDSFMNSHDYHWRKAIDNDTFFSISFSLLAARWGIDNITDDLPSVMNSFGDNLNDLATQLVEKR